MLAPLALVLVACPGYTRTRDDSSAYRTLENQTGFSLLVEIVEPNVYGRSLLEVVESREHSFASCPLSADWGEVRDPCPSEPPRGFVFRAHVLDPLRGLAPDAPLACGRGAPAACVVIPWFSKRIDRVVQWARIT